VNVGSLFSGIGGLELGLERAGMRVVWQVESDPYARAVLRKHWPGVHQYGDVRTLRPDELAYVDLVCGGFPCQDISNAGKRAGIDGERSGLWSEYARIIRELRPRYVLVENVAALLGRGLERVLGDLAACGYDAEWDCIPAAAIGAPHRRDRLFLVAYSNIDGLEADTNQGFIFQPPADAWDTRHAARIHRSEEWNGTPPRAARLFRVGDGIPSDVDRLRCLGNAVVPQVAEWIGRRIMKHASETA
jgi:DNA (cytosine-5)-methyltransferase 1